MFGERMMAGNTVSVTGRCGAVTFALRFASAAVFVLGFYGAVTAGVSPRFITDCEALTSAPHRLSGTAEYRQAADYVEKRLREIGVDEVLVQEYKSTQTKVLSCELEYKNPEYPESTAIRKPLVPFRPNGIFPSQLPKGGITAELVYWGTGRPGISKLPDPHGKIVVLEYNCGVAWFEALRLGAEAIIVAAADTADSRQFYHLTGSGNLPRFYYEGSSDSLPVGRKVTLRGRNTWEPTVGRNIVGYIKGKKPQFGLGMSELIIVGANLDSYGEVPRRSPGGRAAANCAGLLKIAEQFAKNRPDRHMMFVFFDGQARSHEGASHFYQAIDKVTAKVRDIKYETQKANLDAERAFLKGLLAATRLDNPHGVENPGIRRKYLQRLKTRVEDRDKMILQKKRFVGERRLKHERGSPEYERATNEMAEIEHQWLSWNQLRRGLDGGVFPDSLRDELDTVVSNIRESAQLRLDELEGEYRYLEVDQELRNLKGDAWISLHVSLLLGDEQKRWGITSGGNSGVYRAKEMSGDPNLTGKLYDALYKISEQGHSGNYPNFESSSVGGLISPRYFKIGPLIHSGEVAERLGIYHTAFTTVQDPFRAEGNPDDFLERLNLGNLESQLNECAAYLRDAAMSSELSLIRVIEPSRMYWLPRWSSANNPEGPHAIANAYGSPYKNRYVPGMTLKIPVDQLKNLYYFYNTDKIPAFDDFRVVRTRENGHFSVGPLKPSKSNPLNASQVTGLKFDETGDILFSTVSSAAGGGDSKERVEASPYGNHGSVLFPPLLYPEKITTYDGEGNADISSSVKTVNDDGMVSWVVLDRKYDYLKLFGTKERPPSIVVLNNGGERSLGGIEKPYGAGLKTTHGVRWIPVRTTFRSAADLWRLNEHRLSLLRSGGILKSSLEEIHSRSKSYIERADTTQDIMAAEALAAAGLNNERPVYFRVKNTLNDLVISVMFLLVVTLPFAFALERLLINAKKVYGRVGGFLLFFVLTFAILYFSHPAFALSAMPLIIFLGFFILVLAGFVITIVVQKFETQLKIMQGMSSTVHSADVSRFGTTVAAMSMGISSMRRRPLRTTLTALTIVLLTFTILCFASFELSPGIDKGFVGALPGYSTVVLKKFFNDRIDPTLISSLKREFGDKTKVNVRYWLPKAKNAELGTKRDAFLETLVSNGELTKHNTIKGVLGIEIDEILRRSDLQRLLECDFEQFAQDGAFLSGPIARRLGLSIGDKIHMGGEEFTLMGMMETSDMASVVDVDQKTVFPQEVKIAPQIDLDKLTAAAEGRQGDGDDQKENDVKELDFASMAVIPSHLAEKIGATPRVVVFYPENNRVADELSETLARRFSVSMYGTATDGVYRYRLSEKASAKGVGDLVLPILLGGLVILGTMLGSVTDREKEIYTFSALGLAPTHVAGLFFIEALVYAVVGGLGGYLVAQGFTGALGVISRFVVVSAPEINYSSTNSIVTMMIVMATVLLSAVYPAMKAGKSANPGVIRNWKMPKAEGDTLNITFPFTVSSYDITGVVSFLKEHFDRFSDTSLGMFMATGNEIESFGKESFGIRSRIALAPFDLGVTQKFELKSKPSEIEGIDEIQIRVDRLSGLSSDWERLNRNLLGDLRRQLLIWRSLPKSTMELYRSRTLDVLAGTTPNGRTGEKDGSTDTDEETQNAS